MTDGRGPDPLRLAEATTEAALVLGLVVLPAAWRTLDGSIAAVLTGMLVILTGAVYALHAVTFDCFRVTGQRVRESVVHLRRED